MKKILIPDNYEQINQSINLIDGYIIGIKGYSVNTFYNIDIDNISDLEEVMLKKEVFISLNKNIENNELDLLKSILIKLKDYDIAGVLYSDVCFINLKKELDLDYPLVWNQEHLTTNYQTINYWYSKGVDGAYLSSDITNKDILQIANHVKTRLMVNIFGYLPMFVSKRHIVKNYLNKFKIKDNSKLYYMEKEATVYPIIDNEVATQVFSGYILNAIKEYFNYKKSGIEYIAFSGFQISNDTLVEVLKIYNKLNSSSIIESEEQICKLVSNVDTGFLYKDTLSKVKKNDK